MSASVIPSPSRRPAVAPGDLNVHDFSGADVDRRRFVVAGGTTAAGESDAMAAAAEHIASRLSGGCWVSDDEGATGSGRRRADKTATPMKRSPLHARSLSFSVGTTPGKQYPSRMSISPAAPAGTPKKYSVTPMKTPSRSSSRKKAQYNNVQDPMSICKGGKTPGNAGKENWVLFLGKNSPSPADAGRSSSVGRRHNTENSGGTGTIDVKKFDLMPPPLPRTPGGGKGTTFSSAAAMRTTPVSPLQNHDPNRDKFGARMDRAAVAAGPVEAGENGGSDGGRGDRAVERKHTDIWDSNHAKVSPPSSPSTTSSRGRTFSLGSSDARDRESSATSRIKTPGGKKMTTSSRGATAAAARCAPTPPRRSRSVTGATASRSFFGTDHEPTSTSTPTSSEQCSATMSASRPSSRQVSCPVSTARLNDPPRASASFNVGIKSVASSANGHTTHNVSAPVGAAGLATEADEAFGSTGRSCPTNGSASGGFIGELLAEKAREFAEQAGAEALVGMPWQAARGFTRALRIVPKGASVGRVELLLARARVLSSLGKHEACAEDCRAALRLDPTVIGGVTLLGYACLRLGIHGEASRFLSEGLALALSQPDPSVRAEAQRVCRTGIEETSVVGSALESGARAAAHGQHDAMLAAAERVLEIAPQCTVAQEMRTAALLGVMRPAACVTFCETSCIRPRADPEDDSPWPPASGTAGVTPVLAALGMAERVARCYVSALRGCGREETAVLITQALRCLDPSLAWCLEDTARWALVRRLRSEGEVLAAAGKYDKAVRAFTQALEADPGAVIPNAEAFCLRGSSRLGQGKALEALDDCYRALSLVSLEGRTDGPFASARAKAILVRGRAYLALSRLAEAVSDLQGCLKCDSGLEEAYAHLAIAERRQNEAESQRRQRERQERERKERQAAAAAASAEEKARAEAAWAKKREAQARAERAAPAAEARRSAAAAAAAAAASSASFRRTPRQRPLSPFTKPQTPSTRTAAGAGADQTIKTPARSPKIESDSYYRRLGLSKDASEVAIKKAYRKLALKYHPDKNKAEGAAHSFRLVSEAYRILISPDSKQQYDRTRRFSIETPPSNDARGNANSGRGRSRGAGPHGPHGSRGASHAGGYDSGSRGYGKDTSSYW